MKVQHFTNLLHYIWVWCAVLINVIITGVVFLFVHPDSWKKVLISGSVACLFTNAGAILLIWEAGGLKYHEDSRHHKSEYVCGVLLSLLLAWYTFDKASIIGAVIIVFAMFIEAGVAVLIHYRYRIKNRIAQKRKNRKDSDK